MPFLTFLPAFPDPEDPVEVKQPVDLLPGGVGRDGDPLLDRPGHRLRDLPVVAVVAVAVLARGMIAPLQGQLLIGEALVPGVFA